LINKLKSINQIGQMDPIMPKQRGKKVKLVIYLTNDEELNLSREREEYQSMTIETLRRICIKKCITMGREVAKEEV
jgi:hypothetical protein